MSPPPHFLSHIDFQHSTCFLSQWLSIQVHKDKASGKEYCWEELMLKLSATLNQWFASCLTDVQCHNEPLEIVSTLWYPWVCCKAPGRSSGTFWELGLKCYWCCWFKNSTLRTTVLMSQRVHKARVSELLLIFLWQYLIPLRCWKGRNAEKYIQIPHQWFFISVTEELGGEGIRVNKDTTKELSIRFEVRSTNYCVPMLLCNT